MSNLVISVVTPDSVAMILDQLYPTVGETCTSLDRVARYMDGLATGAFYFSTVTENVGAVQASGTLTMTGAATAGQTLTIANVTFTAETSGATGNQYNLSATVATQAANIAAAVNASSSVNEIVTATSALGVVTLKAVLPGVQGNAIELSAGNTSNMTAVAFASGSNGTSVTLI